MHGQLDKIRKNTQHLTNLTDVFCLTVKSNKYVINEINDITLKLTS